MREFAEKAGAPVCDTLMGKGVLVIGIVTPAISTSWKESFPSSGRFTLQVIATIDITKDVTANQCEYTKMPAAEKIVKESDNEADIEKAVALIKNLFQAAADSRYR